MPRRRFRKSSRKKRGRRNFRRKFRKRRKSQIYRQPFGKTKCLQHRYVETSLVLASAGVGLPATHNFLANSAYDPDGTLGGHQPYGFDQMTNFYHHYTVIGCKALVKIRQNTNTTSIVMLAVDAGATAFADLVAVRTRIEAGGCKKIIINGANQVQRTRTMSIRINPNKFLGIGNPMSSSIVRGTTGGLGVGSSPTELAYLKLVVAPIEAALAGITCTITLDYTIVYSEPKIGVPS